VPPLFVLYLILFPVAVNLLPERSLLSLLLVVLSLLYWPLLLGQTVVSMARLGFFRSLTALPLLFATHCFYGVGFWRGLFARIERTKPASTDVTFERITL
jgi:hypothetical protein